MKFKEKFDLFACVSEYNWDNDTLNIFVENYSVHDFMKAIKQYVNFDIAVVGVEIDNVMLSTETKVELIKPYLIPIESMTEEQKLEYYRLQVKVIYNSKGLVNLDIIEYVNWCYKNHLDINNLIPNRLANDATGLGIY